MTDQAIYGMMVEFETAEQLLDAAHSAMAAGYKRVETYTPMPVHGLAEIIGVQRTPVARIVLTGGLLGCIGGYALQYYMTVISYAHNVGGRPVHSWPAYIPVTFETTVLCAALSAVFGMLALNRLPMPYHPAFNVPGFKRATQDRFFLCIRSIDPQFDVMETRAFLKKQGGLEVTNVEP
jgi:ActD protein